MNAIFYSYWIIIKKEVIAAVQNFFKNGKLLKQMNHTNIALIPKIPNPSLPHHYHPISLTNAIYKILTKILANHLKITLPRMISSLQIAFVHGRNIKENTTIAYELFHDLNNKLGRK